MFCIRIIAFVHMEVEVTSKNKLMLDCIIVCQKMCKFIVEFRQCVYVFFLFGSGRYSTTVVIDFPLTSASISRYANVFRLYSFSSFPFIWDLTKHATPLHLYARHEVCGSTCIHLHFPVNLLQQDLLLLSSSQ